LKLSGLNWSLGSVRITKAVSAVTFTATSTALTRALSVVPIISSQVTSAAMPTAGRLMKPPGAPPRNSGADESATGSSTPNVSRKIVPVK